jgi:predicted nucleic acid-binding Zn ribbon protein
MPPDPERARLAAESLARARADAWARGERPAGSWGAKPSPGGYGGAGSPPIGGSLGGLPPRTTQDPQPLNAAVGGLLSARGWRQQAAVGAVFSGWTGIVGPQLATHTKPEGFSEGELVVAADSDAWAAQIRLMAPQLLKRLAEELGHGTVRRIRVRGPAGQNRRSGRLRAR